MEVQASYQGGEDRGREMVKVHVVPMERRRGGNMVGASSEGVKTRRILRSAEGGFAIYGQGRNGRALGLPLVKGLEARRQGHIMYRGIGNRGHSSWSGRQESACIENRREFESNGPESSTSEASV
jgi:hypothetical protein